MVQIVTDSTADMPAEWKTRYGINVVPINLHLGNRSYLDGIDLDSDRFFQLIQQLREIPKTAAPTPEQFQELYRRIARAGEVILSIHASDRLSATFETCAAVARDLANEIRVIPFNSLGGSAAIGFMCREASELARKGASVEAIIQRLEKMRDQTAVWLTLDTLEFARMGGRVGALASALASALKLKPIIELQEGMLVMTGKVRTRARAIDQLLSKARERFADQAVNVAVMHVRAREVAEEVRRRVEATLNCRELFIGQINNTVTTHLGPGAVGIVAYPADLPDPVA
jgi:DegV family protein with EDD domain